MVDGLSLSLFWINDSGMSADTALAHNPSVPKCFPKQGNLQSSVYSIIYRLRTLQSKRHRRNSRMTSKWSTKAEVKVLVALLHVLHDGAPMLDRDTCKQLKAEMSDEDFTEGAIRSVHLPHAIETS